MTTARSIAGLLFVMCLTVPAAGAHAEQPRDWMFRAAPEGARLIVDLVYPGTQIGYERTFAIYGQANAVTLRGSNLLTSAFNDTRADVELRLLVLNLGISAGYRDNWRSCIFLANEPVDRTAMRNCDNTVGFVGLPANHGREDWGYLEGHIGLSLPFNDHLVYSGTNTALFEDRPARSLDLRNGVVRDPDVLIRSDHFLLVHHRDFGGFGPLFQMLDYELDGKRTTQLNYGFMLVGRPGFARDNDLLYLEMLFHFGDTLGGDDNRANWGTASIYSSGSTLVTGTKVPLSFVLAYRMLFDL